MSSGDEGYYIESGRGGIAVSLTEDLLDMPDAWRTYKEIRTNCLTHLDQNAFRNRRLPRDHQYGTPPIQFSE